MSTTSSALAEAIARAIAVRRSSTASCATGLAAVALASAADHSHQASAARSRNVLQRDQGLFERVGRVGVIDYHERLAASAQALHASRDRLQLCERSEER